MEYKHHTCYALYWKQWPIRRIASYCGKKLTNKEKELSACCKPSSFLKHLKAILYKILKNKCLSLFKKLR